MSTGLLHGAQATALVMCHDPARRTMRGLPHYAVPSLADCIAENLRVARLTAPNVRMAGVALNTSELDADAARRACAEAADATGLPAVDPVRDGVGAIIDRLVG